MSTRRLPLTSNPNVANSPLRASASNGSKRIRTHAELQREDAYGQPPPAKRLMLHSGVSHSGLSTSQKTSSRSATQKPSTRAATTERASQPVSYKLTEKEIDNVRQWQAQTRARFPRMVFYFESVPDEQRVKLTKQVTHLGAREEKFFSINITHVVTTRPIPSIPSEKAAQEGGVHAGMHASLEQPKTIDPSLLNRTADAGINVPPVKRKLVFDTASSRRLPMHIHDDAARRHKARNTDVLHKAREMGKKIWSLDKLQKILDMVMEPDPYKSALVGQGLQSTATREATAARGGEPSNLLQLLQNERVHGPSDRDPTVTSKELNYFKGPYIYVYDVEEKQRPIMVREYAKVSDKQHGEWPQFRVASLGRCPFIEDMEPVEKQRGHVREREKGRASKVAPAAAAAVEEVEAPVPKSRQGVPARPATGKRTLGEMEDGQNRGAAPAVYPAETFDMAKVSNPPVVDFRAENAFMSRAKTGRLLAGEPVASGVQPSHITSAIRSQMISSTSGTLGAKAGTSKEVHGLQRQVLQKNSVPATVSQDGAPRRPGDMGHDGSTFVRTASLGRTWHRKLDMVDEEEAGSSRKVTQATLRRTESAPVRNQAKQRKRDPKPGYCENCQDKFDDFDEHISSRSHRKFAECDENWVQLDFLLSQLRRPPRYHHPADGDGERW